jgi:hypothetical protein
MCMSAYFTTSYCGGTIGCIDAVTTRARGNGMIVWSAILAASEALGELGCSLRRVDAADAGLDRGEEDAEEDDDEDDDAAST